MYPISKTAYNKYKKCFTCEKVTPCKNCPLNIKWENMDRGYYRATGNLITGEEFKLRIPYQKEPSAEITLKQVNNVAQLNSWILILLLYTKYNIEITLKYIDKKDKKTLNNIIPIDKQRGTIHKRKITNKE